jgi:hypothetical protein
VLDSTTLERKTDKMAVQEDILVAGEVVDAELRWALLQRVIASPRLKRAARMREFLLFIGQRSIRDGCDQIHEQEIGCEVFGRPAGYDTSVDNIVRVNATDLRKRIDEYFANDGAHETLVLSIPRGSYKPVFRLRSIEPERVEKVSDTIIPLTEPSKPLRNPSYSLLILAALIIVVLAIGCCMLWVQNAALRTSLHSWQSNSSLRGFWSGILGSGTNTDVILADTSFALIEDITKKPIPLSAYLSREYISQIQSPALSQDRRDDLNLIVARSTGSLGDFRVAQRITALDPLSKNFHLYYARDYRPELTKQDNMILIGSRKSNPWVDLFAGELNFTLEYDPDRYLSFVKNRQPAAGEQGTYVAPRASNTVSGYSVVAYLPNPDHTGKVVIFAGTGSEATEAAGEFLTSEDSLAGFLKLLHVSALPYFEVLLKTTHLNGTPMNATVVAYRTYPNPR